MNMQALELPQSVRIGPHDYEVNPPGWRLPEDHWGLCSHENLEIVVDPDLHPMQVAETWLHELLHGFWNLSNLEDIGCELEERVVVGLARSMLGFMRDNPNGLDLVHEAIGMGRREALMLRAARGTF